MKFHIYTNDSSFTILENITLLINKLVYSENNNALPLKYISKLVNDFSNLLKESDYYDVEIKVGKQDVHILRQLYQIIGLKDQTMVLFYLKKKIFPQKYLKLF